MKSNKIERYSDQETYYLGHLEKQKKAINNSFSILGRHHKNLDDFVREQIKSLKNKSVILDAGCGLSTWPNDNIRKKYTIYGVDGEPDAISICKKLYGDKYYSVGNLYKLNYKSSTFDAVVMREVIEHFIIPEKAVKEIYRILKPGGVLILTTPNYDSLLLHFIEHTYNRFFGGPCKPYRDDVHPSKFRPRTLRKLLGKFFLVKDLHTIDYGISQCCMVIKK
ncbi:class I SAM-dependent methyltransferase [Candidatus Roizmanbacteria bacterium]|nr:class I SAM-dependent methyltransferase [Candidatus Roizmanbacteria bacterium]